MWIKGFESLREEKNGITGRWGAYFSLQNKMFAVLFVDPPVVVPKGSEGDRYRTRTTRDCATPILQTLGETQAL